MKIIYYVICNDNERENIENDNDKKCNNNMKMKYQWKAWIENNEKKW